MTSKAKYYTFNLVLQGTFRNTALRSVSVMSDKEFFHLKQEGVMTMPVNQKDIQARRRR